jgi:phosphoribosylformylglycinamidine synthase
VTVVVESTGTPFTSGLALGDELVIPIKHGEGNWVVDDGLYGELVERGQVALRYRDDVNGSRDRVAGVTNRAGNVLGLMPHPEHAVDPLLGPTGGAPLLEGLIAAADEPLAAHALGSR